MNFPPGFTRQADFLAFKKAINSESALELLFHLFELCHNQKSPEIEIPDEFTAEILDVPKGIEPSLVKSALISTGMITQTSGKDTFRVDVYLIHNEGLLKARWGGPYGGRPRKKHDEAEPRMASPPKSSIPAKPVAVPVASDKLDEDVPF